MLKVERKISQNLNSGQTLIETLAGMFILTMGIAAAAGLAVSALNSSTNITKQIIATGLAREGLEAVRNMRDTNWLKDTLNINGCYDFATNQANKASCYTDWLTQQKYPSSSGFIGENLDPSANPSHNYTLGLGYNSVNYPNYWILYRRPDLSLCDSYSLNLNTSNPTTDTFPYGVGYYKPMCSGIGTSDYYRKIILTSIAGAAPYNQNVGPLLKVQSQIWWVDKKCSRSADWPGLGKCSIELDTYLTNWKDY